MWSHLFFFISSKFQSMKMLYLKECIRKCVIQKFLDNNAHSYPYKVHIIEIQNELEWEFNGDTLIL